MLFSMPNQADEARTAEAIAWREVGISTDVDARRVFSHTRARRCRAQPNQLLTIPQSKEAYSPMSFSRVLKNPVMFAIAFCATES